MEEKERIERFLMEGCDCGRRAPCCMLFSREYYETLRAQCQELERSTLDMVIMGYLLGSLKNTKSERQRITYYHRGHKVTYL